MSSPIIPGTEWGVEQNIEENDVYQFYLLDEPNSRYIPLKSSHDNKDTLHYFYPLMLNDIYHDMWRTVAVGEPYTEMQCILAENNIKMENSYIVVALDSNRNIVNKVKLTYPDKIEMIIPPPVN